MHIPGHLALALAQHHLLTRLTPGKPALTPVLVACLLPDAVDKTIGYFFHWMPNGRHYSHNLFSLALTTLLLTCWRGPAVGFSWFLSYLGHLLADSNSLVPWFFPLKQYPFKPGRLRFDRHQLWCESLLLGLVLLLRRLNGR